MSYESKLGRIMGRDIDYVRVTEQELQQILDGNATDLVDAITQEYWSDVV